MGSGWAVSGCNLGLSCTALGCDDGVRITMKGVATKFAGSLPLVIKSCADGGSCVLVKVSETGGVFACEQEESPIFSNCTVTPAGDVSLSVVFHVAEEIDVATMGVTVLDSANATVFDGEQNAALLDVEANGPGCGVTCRRGEALFVP